jgi:hypothetical protein
MEAGGWRGCRGEKKCPRVRVHTRRLRFSKHSAVQSEIDRYLQKNNFLLFAKCLEMKNF